MRAARFVFPVLLLSVLVAALPDAVPSVAAAAERADSTRTGRFFWRGRPLPECRSFLITEFGVHYQINVEPYGFNGRGVFVTGDLGYMKNRTKHEAVGGLVHLGAGNDFSGAGLGVRYRRWLSQDLSADVTAGVDLIGSNLKAPGPWAEVGFSAADIVTITIRGEHWTREVYLEDYSLDTKSFTSWHVGAKGGSYLAAGGVVAGVIGYAIIIAILVGRSN